MGNDNFDRKPPLEEAYARGDHRAVYKLAIVERAERTAAHQRYMGNVCPRCGDAAEEPSPLKSALERVEALESFVSSVGRKISSLRRELRALRPKYSSEDEP